MTIHAIIQDITLYYNVVWCKVVQSGTLNVIQLHCIDPDITFNIWQCTVQS